jgi:asparagine synthetase B (glutamine-hydrolysing)
MARGVASGVEEAVRPQVVSDVPLGSVLSGGVGSSAIVAAMTSANIVSVLVDRLRGGRRRTRDSPRRLPYARKVGSLFGYGLWRTHLGAECARAASEGDGVLD